MWPWIYTAATIIAGLFFYWLRREHRAWYGLSEIIVSLGLMYLKYFPHVLGTLLTAGPTRSPTFLETVAFDAVPIFVMVYAFVRGCDNLVEDCPWLKHLIGPSHPPH